MVFYSSFLFFYSGSNLSRYLSDRRICLTDRRVMAPGCQRTCRISKILVTYFTGCIKPPRRHIFTCFSLGDLTFSINAQKRFGLDEIQKQTIIYDELSLILHNICYSGARSSPDHRVESLAIFYRVAFKTKCIHVIQIFSITS